MIPLSVIWEFLYCNFTPLPTDCQETGVLKDDVVRELLGQRQLQTTVKPGDPRFQAFARILTSRMLPELFAQHKLQKVDPKSTTYLLRRLTRTEQEVNLRNIPMFSEALKEQLAKEVREEIMGRKSAQNLLKLANASVQQVNGTKRSSSEKDGSTSDSENDSKRAKLSSSSEPAGASNSGSAASSSTSLATAPSTSAPTSPSKKDANQAAGPQQQGRYYLMNPYSIAVQAADEWRKEAEHLRAKYIEIKLEVDKIKAELRKKDRTTAIELTNLKSEFIRMQTALVVLTQSFASVPHQFLNAAHTPIQLPATAPAPSLNHQTHTIQTSAPHPATRSSTRSRSNDESRASEENSSRNNSTDSHH